RIQNLGNLGDKVRVRPGYARNFLMPQGKALAATPANMEVFEARRAELERQQGEDLAVAQRRADALGALDIKLERRASEEGKIFGSVSVNDIAQACTEAGCELQRSEVRLPDGPIRELGEHVVSLNIHADVEATINIEVVAA
ncbi:MAG: 50S ribosomal protein L9, partial [Gammaproteobacteria bacterium]|nr:50S ribosomal protein L9 [Gammaproteobacteria bacterium]